jgi:hypothetical protein
MRMRGGGVKDGLGFDLADDFETIRFRTLYKRTNLAISVGSTTTTTTRQGFADR